MTQQIAGHRGTAVENLAKQLEIAQAQGDSFGVHRGCMALAPLYTATGETAKTTWVLHVRIQERERGGGERGGRREKERGGWKRKRERGSAKTVWVHLLFEVLITVLCMSDSS